MDITEFLLARIAEEEAAATSASDGPWRLDSDGTPQALLGASGREVVGGGRWDGKGSVFDTVADARHMARWNPARVLVECEVKRHVVQSYLPG